MVDVIVQKYYDDLINSFDFSTSISPDLKGNEIQYELLSIPHNVNIVGLRREYDISKNDLFLTVFLFNLVKFSFSKDILVGYNKQAAGYHFNTDLSVEDYIYDFKSQFKDFPEAEKLDFESEILFTTNEYDKKDYKFIFSYDKRILI